MIDNNRLTRQGRLMDEENKKPGAARHLFSYQSHRHWRRARVCLTAGLCLAGITACSSNYTIKTTNGVVYQTQGAPDLRGGAYSFIDSEGKEQQVFLSNVAQMHKR